MISASVKNNALEITGEIVSENDDAKNIVAQSKAGADWQLSIGADVKECELVQGKREVNGQEAEGPFYHIKKSVLREVSIVAVGADAHTAMKVTAKFNITNPNHEGEKNTMSEEKKDLKTVTAAAPAKAEPEKKVEAAAPAVKPEQKPDTAKAEAAPAAITASATDLTATAREAAVAAVKAERERVSAIQSSSFTGISVTER